MVSDFLGMKKDGFSFEQEENIRELSKYDFPLCYLKIHFIESFVGDEIEHAVSWNCNITDFIACLDIKLCNIIEWCDILESLGIRLEYPYMIAIHYIYITEILFYYKVYTWLSS